MKIAVVGSGYVGLVAGAGFADFGNDVVCVDVDANKIARLQQGEVPIFEPGLEVLVQRNQREGRLRFTTDVERSIIDVEAVFIAVGTPPGSDGSADLSHVLEVAQTVGKHATGYTMLVTKSTVPVGTAQRIVQILQEWVVRRQNLENSISFAVVSNPEFLKEGDAVNDFMKPARIVVGTDDERARREMRYLYEPFVRTHDRILVMDPRSAEVTKYACNAMLATRISFMNEMARLCDAVGADISAVRAGMAGDDRIGSRFLFPGAGYGGSCFPKDVKAIIATAQEYDQRLQILEAVETVNEAQKGILAECVFRRLGDDLRGMTIAMWGLAFKPQTDDVREAPALTVANKLLAAGARLRLHDPVARTPFAALLPKADSVSYHDDNYDAAAGADALLLVTEWRAYRRPDFSRIRRVMKQQNLVDGRNIWDADYVRKLGFHYQGIGRGRAGTE